MYREHFKLNERPFVHAPGQRFLTANASVTDALARVKHVLTARDSVVLITGGPGVGKSALAEEAIAAVATDAGKLSVARVDLRYADPQEIYGAILLELGETVIPEKPSHALHALRAALLRNAREDTRVVVTLDIGGMSAEIARHLLRVVNLAGERGCQMNIVLMGPHPLHQQIDVPAMIQLRQRVAYRHRVRPLTLAETDRYLRQQLENVGANPTEVLSSNVAAAVYCYVAGVPRLINTLLDATLSEASLQNVQRPDGNIVKRTADGLGWKPMTPAQAGPDSMQRPAAAPARPAAPRPAAPKVAVVATPAVERRDGTRPAAKAPDAPAPSEMTLALRTDALVEPRTPQVALAQDGKSPTAAIFGAGEDAASAPAPLVPAMDEMDTSATGMLRLQDLDERFAESIFGKEGAAELQKKRAP